MSSPDMLALLLDIRDGQARLTAEVLNLKRAVEGNGQPGLVQRMESLENSRSRLRGAGTAATVLWSIITAWFHWHSK